ncbi:hypothetical protein PNOK_0527600 [Pyrrhoderma noxium]|uniref:Protein root UVB sensitive/RUS domain-containing protein n=1 Tax=Pyrrhoderma noxium TaxID=2282107 RepID=A0A286UG22_9AGAM|nr:hypothetical protein PNOK_0527600 [Pyrrhoderma noxium]
MSDNSPHNNQYNYEANSSYYSPIQPPFTQAFRLPTTEHLEYQLSLYDMPEQYDYHPQQNQTQPALTGANAQPRPQYHYHQGFSSQGNQPVSNSHSHASNYPVVNTQYPPYNSTSYQTPFTYGQNDQQSRLTPVQGQGSTALVSTQGQGQIAIERTNYGPCPVILSDSKHALFSVILPNRYKCLINSQTLCDIFLPSGFPDSVTSDYIKYQLYDSLQAFCSSIVGLLSSRAVLEGFGVGDEHASSTKAVLLTVSQDATGRLATILFAWKYGPALAPEAKMYRLSADIFNDIAFVLDCLSPVLPSHIRLASICLAGVMRAICGVCGGASKAALSMHFAKVGNVGELNAKDASQETVIGLLGMLCGSYILSKIISTMMTWTVLIVLLATHLGLNYLAVRAVVLRTLNRQRANLIYKEFRFEGRMPSPSEVARLEHIFQNPSVIRDSRTGKTLGSILVCSTVEDLTDTISNTYMPDQLWRETFDIFQKESYILLTSPKKPQLG